LNTPGFIPGSDNQFIDGGASLNKKYFCFLIQIPADFIERKSVIYKSNKVIVNYLVKGREIRETFSFRIW
jgi:hypothetical protein